jgi:hypothetical protein
MAGTRPADALPVLDRALALPPMPPLPPLAPRRLDAVAKKGRVRVFGDGVTGAKATPKHAEEGRARSYIPLTDDDDEEEGDRAAPSYPARSSQPRSSLQEKFFWGRWSSSSAASNAEDAPSNNLLAKNTLSFWAGADPRPLYSST